VLSKQLCLLTVCYVGALIIYSQQLPNSAAQQAPVPASSSSAEIFAPGIISGPANDGSPTFSPDGNTLFFTRSSSRWSIILESHQVQGHWSEPKIASFSGEWSDSSPAMSPDGAYLVFVSVRPVSHGSAEAQSNKDANPMASHIWRVNRLASGWSVPVPLPDTVNCCQWMFRPSVAADGSVYFVAAEKGKSLRLFPHSMRTAPTGTQSLFRSVMAASRTSIRKLLPTNPS
jgi:dipeptidyl aminopeptidase/acylaminoacyl peptidase